MQSYTEKNIERTKYQYPYVDKNEFILFGGPN